ncbi:putative Transcription factor domain-containing protein [Seiridium cardinale]
MPPSDDGLVQPMYEIGDQWSPMAFRETDTPVSMQEVQYSTAALNDLACLDDLWSFMDITGDPDFELQTPDHDGQSALDDGERNHNETDRDSQSDLTRNSPRRTIEIHVEDQEPLQHYLSTMTKFSKMRSSNQETVYTTIFSTLALSHRPLFQAMMAWSSLHLAQTRGSSTEDAEQRYIQASTLLLEDPEPLERLDVTMNTIWMLLQYEHLLATGVDNFCHLLKYAADILQKVFDQYDKGEVMARLGTTGVRALVWMSAFDARASLFGKAGYLLGTLRRCSYLYELIGQCAVITESGAPDMQRGLHNASSYESSLRLAIRLRIILGQIRLLRLSQNSEEQRQGWSAVDDSLRTLRSELDAKHNLLTQSGYSVVQGESTAVPYASSDHYNCLMLCATFYGAVILYQECRPPPTAFAIDDFLPSADCALRIIRLANRASMARPNSPQATWPHLLFLAGMVCKDPIYQSWTIQTLQKSEVWGRNLYKTRVLLEAMISSNDSNAKIDQIVTVMHQTTGLFII